MEVTPTLQGVVFDLDGVIVDSEPLHCRAIRDAVRLRDLSFTDEEYGRELIGLDDRTLIARIHELRGRCLDERDLPALLCRKTEALGSIVSAGVPAVPGAVELLREAAATLRVALYSGSRREEIDLLLAGLGADVPGLFRYVVSRDDVRAPKPDPEGYRCAADALGLPTSGCAAIEDTSHGVAAARAAGLWVLAVNTAGRPERLAAADRIEPGLADVALADLREWFSSGRRT